MKNIFTIVFVLMVSYQLQAQEIQLYSLDQVINIAKEQSLSAQQAENRKENNYWLYKQFKSVYLPQLVLNGNLPNFNRSITPVTQPDGSTEFRAVSVANSDVNLSLQQNVGLTGGSVYFGSTLQRIDNFEGINQGTSYAGQPLVVGFNQPLFTYNPFKWNKKIEPLKYEESQKKFVEEMEKVAYDATQYFFDMLLAQINHQVASTNLANNDTIFKIGKGRYNLGKIAENELLQLELNVITAERNLQSANLDVERTSLNLKTFLGLPPTVDNTTLSLPKELPDLTISTDIAIQEAQINRQQYISFQRRRLEAERDVAKAKGDAGLQINLSGQFGLTQQAMDPSGVYQDPNDQQQFRLGFNIPLVDWGRRKSAVETAVSNQRLVESTVQQEEQLFTQNIYMLARQIPIIRNKALSTERAKVIAEKSYEIARQRYLVGKISVTDLNITLRDKDAATREYLAALKEFWLAFYQLRMFTLYDFIKNEKIMMY
ncbi:TolC family protein [Flammeovirga yaeyamensis]|uniref:TolC family protein n=1 Tax=Flammeovirga yaeyamensis TaxID=367791 RepID=A0AAX1N043_9BACT|nr:TolC family protein [Flammeovirga yaeyamensis]MBB3700113.1 outer membrane protein TolC [Flammeovirga yaeyamensis]NMF37256.1 TolC family protein [Flammeovirga yaeyamensis]QWG00944.1 TolC family protein [Flammeovirga yaeyamensis]